MKLNKPAFWDKKIGLISILLYPISLIYFGIILLKKKITKEKIFKIPIVCVGNIYLGGTGKTPTSILLAKELSKNGKKTAILRKYYKSHKDEHNLIRDKFENLILCKNRTLGLLDAERLNYDFVILDDGLQDYQIKKNINIVCFNENQLIGNGLVLPSGPLREKLSSLKNKDVILINGKKNINFEEQILKINNNLEIFYSSFEPINLDQFKSKKIIAVAGIGNPENFFQLLEKNDIFIEKKIIFPDHHELSKIEFEELISEADKRNCQILMTEKDYYKIKEFGTNKIEYLKVSLKINNLNKLIKKIESLNDQNL